MVASTAVHRLTQLDRAEHVSEVNLYSAGATTETLAWMGHVSANSDSVILPIAYSRPEEQEEEEEEEGFHISCASRPPSRPPAPASSSSALAHGSLRTTPGPRRQPGPRT